MDPAALERRYAELQRYVGWQAEDERRVRATAGLLGPSLPALIDDFYAEVERHDATRNVITGGADQINRLKGTLVVWIRELLAGPYDRDYVVRRWRVGWRHVEIGLDQVYTNMALSRLRAGLTRCLDEAWRGEPAELSATVAALNKLLDLDLAVIEDAYQSEYLARQQRGERLAAIGQVAGGVAHELRNPLNVIKTSVYFLLNARSPSPEKVAEHLRRVEQHVTLADGVITALSNFAKMPVPDMHPFSVEQCLREALETNPPPPGVKATFDFPADLPAALGDRDQVRIVFANLIRNAREAMPQGGTMTLAGRYGPGGLEVSITDTGVGIPAAELGRIMEPLYSTKARGLGLGLSLARSILEKNKASLRAESEPGKGSRFTVRLASEAP